MANHPQIQHVAVARPATCDDCFFRRAQLCALAGNTVCPTFRPAADARPEEPVRHLRAVYA